jgi:hypothetical protein
MGMEWVLARSMMDWRRGRGRMAPVGLLGLLRIIRVVVGLIRVLRSSIEGSQLFEGLACQRETVAPSWAGTS